MKYTAIFTLVFLSFQLQGQKIPRLEISANTVWSGNFYLLEVDTLVMFDNATLKLIKPEVTLRINFLAIGRNCKIDGSGEPGLPGANGSDGKPYQPDNDGTNGNNGGPGGAGTKLTLQINALAPIQSSFLPHWPNYAGAWLTVDISGGPGGKGGDGGDGGPRRAVCGITIAGANGGDAGAGGLSGPSYNPEILLTNSVNRDAVIVRNETYPNKPGKGGAAGKVETGYCQDGSVAASVPGRPGKGSTYRDNENSGPARQPTEFGQPNFRSTAGTPTGSPASALLSFPDPPPSPSAMIAELPIRVPPDATLGSVESLLSTALMRAGYQPLRYFNFKQGYAIVTGLEQFTEQGVPLTGPDRWAKDVQYGADFSLAAYLRSLFSVRKGYFRTIVFLVSEEAIPIAAQRLSRAEARSWPSSGYSKLPAAIAGRPYTENHFVSVFIYEFSASENTTGTVFSEPSLISAENHLRGANLWPLLIAE